MGILYLLHWTNAAQGQLDLTPRELQVSCSFTTNLVFSEPILTVDLGSRELLAQRAAGVQNILQVKASREDFQQTNLTVITQDGLLHSFLVNYADHPAAINITVTNDTAMPTGLIFSGSKVPPLELRENIHWVRHTNQRPLHLKKERNDITLSLDGVFIQKNRMYFRFRLFNASHIAYDIDQFRLFLRDVKRPKRTAIQEVELFPEFVEGEQEKLLGHIQQTLVFVVPKFTVPKGKYLSVELMEASGGRNIELFVKNRHILKAMPVPLFY